ncbi:uncharacterized protein A1O5_07075 [Cladophialophora psammophila CBS 110553]|uniref:ABC multidrug transporter MDR2 n=1 Tax=Cladophialophora psammophila CBS 110553 TaxID=1182543 RepID=W9WP99_9EURO|nr:uncharacterized protein A1O5_07075 [Cladophialophora psammophila CBS 110553]EXJ70002.1 hypothetical protein A1O5_07075 [Cladophialophora psammophila CBS 110553]
MAEKSGHGVEIQNDSIQRDILSSQLSMPTVKVSYWTLFRYASRQELSILGLAASCAAVSGAVTPLMTLVLGSLAGQFTGFQDGSTAVSEFNQRLSRLALYFVYLGIGSFVTVFISIQGFSFAGEAITQRTCEAYLQSIMRQNIAFFDKVGAGEVVSRITGDMNMIQDGISQKLGLTVAGVTTFFAALAVGFVRSWKLTLIMLSVTVLIILIMGGAGKGMKKYQIQANDAYAVGATVAEEAFTSIRSTTAFGTQPWLAKQFGMHLDNVRRFDFKSKAFLAFMIAAMMAILSFQYGLAFWEGSRLLHDGSISVSKIITVIFSSMLAGVSIGHVAPHFGAFATATAAGQKIFHVIDRKSPLDPMSGTGKRPASVDGEIFFRNVRHVYPSRPDKVVLNDLTLVVPSGKVTAVVGVSGSGKSTLVGLLERFYQPVGGEISLDGWPLQELNLHWLRGQIAIVSQEPVLFNTTVYENIRFGLLGTNLEDAPKEKVAGLIEEAARIANAFDFISNLPGGFQARVGERGMLLSGGQRQRIAIARAVVSNPKILLLDESTASLDPQAERIVRVALDAASKNRTTLVIAHRLSTIKHADNIAVLNAGILVEQGTHDELVRNRGVYHSLVEAQQIESNYPSEGIDFQDGGILGTENAKESDLMSTQISADGTSPQDKDQPHYSLWELIKFIWSLNQHEQLWMALGLTVSMGSGTGYSIVAIFYGNSIISLVNPTASTGGHDINFWCAMFLMLGLALFLLYMVQGMTFAWTSSRLIRHTRDLTFRAILRQDMTFFDMKGNGSGALSSMLSTEAAMIAGMSGATLAALLNFIVSIISAIAVACSFGWKLALVCTSTMPLLLACGFLRTWVMADLEKRTRRQTEAAGFACEAASAIRTVASLRMERDVCSRYSQMLRQQTKQDFRSLLLSSMLYATSQSLIFFASGLAFWYGGTLIASGEYTVKQFFVCFVAVIWGSQAAGAIFSYAGDISNARAAAARVKSLLSQTPSMDSWSVTGKDIQVGLKGRIELRNVSFSYPTRPGRLVLKNVTLTAEPGQFIALVGGSGSGKSTVVSLLERFYDVVSGGIYVDGNDISTYQVQNYRSQLALVSQETTLHMGTIKDNILADKEDASEAEIIQACKDANIYDYILSLPDGLNTSVGTKGSLLSGGQRQRIAIAKALLRNPKILLLDEASSALDSASEAAIQAALDRAAKGRTTIAVAHRLSTIQHADAIYVFERGTVVERGNHAELMSKGGRYAELVRLQEISLG